MFNVHLKLIAMALMWATSYPLGRYLADYEAPQAIVAVRAFIAFAFLLAIAKRRAEPRLDLNGKLLLQFIALGICGLCLHNFLLFEALEHTQASTGAVINGAIPVVVMALDYLLFRRTVARWSLLGIASSFVGAAIVVSHGDLLATIRHGIGYGESLFLIAITAWGFYTIIARPLLERFSVLNVTAYACLAGAILMLPAVVWNLDASIALLSDPIIVVLLAVQGVLTIGLGFLWYYEGVQALGPMRASVYINLVPIFGVVLAAITIGEVPDAPLLAGGTLVVGGLMLVNRTEIARASATTAKKRI